MIELGRAFQPGRLKDATRIWDERAGARHSEMDAFNTKKREVDIQLKVSRADGRRCNLNVRDRSRTVQPDQALPFVAGRARAQC